MSFQGMVLAAASALEFEVASDLLQAKGVPANVKQEILATHLKEWRSENFFIPQWALQDFGNYLEALVREVELDPLLSRICLFATAIFKIPRIMPELMRQYRPLLTLYGVQPDTRVLRVLLLSKGNWWTRGGTEQNAVRQKTLEAMWKSAYEGADWSRIETWVALRRAMNSLHLNGRSNMSDILKWMLINAPQLPGTQPDIQKLIGWMHDHILTRTFRALGYRPDILCNTGFRQYHFTLGALHSALGAPHHRWVGLVLLRGGGKNCGALSGGKGLTAGERELILRLLKPWFGDYLTDTKDLTL